MRTSPRTCSRKPFLRISKGLPDFEGRSSLKTWAFKIATRTAIDHWRRADGGLRVVEVEEAEALPDDVEDIGERLAIDEMGACVRGEIDRLPEDYRAAIILHDLEGLTAVETSQIIGCSLPTAKTRIHRARARLRKALEEDCRFYRDRDQVLRCDRKPLREG